MYHKMNKILIVILFLCVDFRITQAQDTDALMQPRIAVIDDFTEKTMDFDADGIPDSTHGDRVFRFLEEGLPDANLVKFDLNDYINPEYEPFQGPQIENVLKKLVSDVKNGVHYDAVNISMSHDVEYECEKCIPGITPENLKDNYEQIRAYLKQGYFDQKIADNNVSLIEELINAGVKVYIGAGNKGNNAYNAYGLAKGAIIVGSTKSDGTKSDFSADNSLVNKWARGSFPVAVTQDGIDYTADGTTDVRFEDLSSIGENGNEQAKEAFINFAKGRFIRGTSYAVPNAVVNDFKTEI